MEDEKIERINDFLLQNGSSKDAISIQLLQQLEDIDTAIQSRLYSIQEAKYTLKRSIINVSSISEDSGISRKTFYNNNFLRLYVEKYSTSDEKTVAASDIERLKQHCDEKDRQIHQFILRDIETENLRYENKQLQHEIQMLQTRNNSLEEQYERLQKEYNHLKESSSISSKVLPFPQKSKK